MKYRIKSAVAIAAASLVAFASPASAATLLQYNFAGNSGTESSEAAINVAANLTGLNFTRGPGLGPNTGANSINSNGWSTLASDYLGFGLTVASGFTATVNQLVFGSQASGTGPGRLNVLASVDGGTTFSTVGSFTQIAGATSRTLNITPVTSGTSLLFRFVAANNTAAGGGTIGSNGTFRVQNSGTPSSAANPFTLAGDVLAIPAAAVPEPATWAMMIGGIGVAGGALRRRRRIALRLA